MSLSERLIDAFLALEETRRFSLAAEHCHVSPSAFSQMITRLEEQVGARLFDRDTRNVVLTPEGQAFSVGAHRIAAEIDASIAALRERTSLATGRVTLAAPPSLAAEWLPRIFAGFQREHPGIALRLHDVVSDRCLALIAGGEVDFGINAQSGNDLEFESVLLFKEPLFLVCRQDDPLARCDQVTVRDLRGRTFIQTIRSGSVWQQTQSLLERAKARDTGFEVAQFGSLAGFIEAGFGISIVPRLTLRLCNRPGLVAIPVRDRTAVRSIYLVKRRNRSLAVAAQAMWNELRSQLPFGTDRPVRIEF